MTAERWQSVKEILYQALRLPEAERPAFLDQACAAEPELRQEIESLLAAHDGDSSFLTVRPAFEMPNLPEEMPEQNIGPYRVVEEIGRGGMGAVYLAVRDDGVYEQQVAIKLVKRGMDTDFVLHRFRYERQILAFLNHPYIARMLDGGTTADGRPYFVMEYVQGRPLLQYCQEEQLGLRARLQLFRKVCEALDHAHHNLIVHRDLKPANILVTDEGTPRLLDFGIATLMLPDSPELAATRTIETRMLTPDYSSPEQFLGEPVTTVSDVYSLGAVLYELLTLKRAHVLPTRSHTELARVICEQDPVKPSEAVKNDSPDPSIHGKSLSGDLDRIVLKAMHKDKTRRYSSVEQFSTDIQRFLEGRPVMARGDSLTYRASKFATRNKGIVTAGALAVLCLIGGIIATAWQAHVATVQRDRAERRFNDVRRLATSFLVDNDTLASLSGGTEIRSRLIRRSLEYLDGLSREAGGETNLQRELALAYEKMGDVQGRADGPNVGDTAGALESYRKAAEIRKSILASAPDDLTALHDMAAVTSRLGGALKVAGEYEAGLKLDRQVLELRESIARKEPNNREARRELASSYTTMGGSYFQVGRWQDVLETRQKALAMYEALAAEPGAGAEDWRGLSLAYTRMASILRHNKDLAGAVKEYSRARDTARNGLGKFPNFAPLRQAEATALGGLGSTLLDMGRNDEALSSYRAAQVIHLEQAEADPRDARSQSMLATSHYRIGKALLKMGEARAAMAEFQSALTAREIIAEKNPLNAGARGEVAESFASLGDAYARMRRQAEAMRWYAKARDTIDGLVKQNRANSASLSELARVREEMARLTASAR
jgi:non-specific serine/threonine protein kinase/serine/threonine-protein kinase